jgi:hypothetical protein
VREPRANDLLAGINCLATSKPCHVQVASIRIDVKPTASGRKWRASLDDKFLCASSAPLVTAARLLFARGFDSSCIIEMWHQGADSWALRGRLGAVAAVVLDGERKAQRHAKNGASIRQVAGAAP